MRVKDVITPLLAAANQTPSRQQYRTAGAKISIAPMILRGCAIGERAIIDLDQTGFSIVNIVCLARIGCVVAIPQSAEVRRLELPSFLQPRRFGHDAQPNKAIAVSWVRVAAFALVIAG